MCLRQHMGEVGRGTITRREAQRVEIEFPELSESRRLLKNVSYAWRSR